MSNLGQNMGCVKGQKREGSTSGWFENQQEA